MFNLSVKQVHNLLRSTYCHWRGPAIARNSCCGNQLICWDQQEENSWRMYPERGQCAFLPGHLGVDLSPQSQLFQPAAHILHCPKAHILHCPKRCCRMSWLCLLFPPGAETLFLSEIPEELCHRYLPRVSTKDWETSYQLPWTAPLAHLCAKDSWTHHW